MTWYLHSCIKCKIMHLTNASNVWIEPIQRWLRHGRQQICCIHGTFLVAQGKFDSRAYDKCTNIHNFYFLRGNFCEAIIWHILYEIVLEWMPVISVALCPHWAVVCWQCRFRAWINNYIITFPCSNHNSDLAKCSDCSENLPPIRLSNFKAMH